MSYYYYGTTLVISKDMYKEYVAELEKTYICPTQIFESEKGYIFMFDQIQNFEAITSDICEEICSSHDGEKGYAWKIVTEGESDGDYQLRFGDSCEGDEVNPLFEDFGFVISIPESYLIKELNQ